MVGDVTRDMGASAVTDSGPDAAADTPTRPRVLVVEDDATLIEMLERILVSEGYVVRLARDGQHGLHAALTGEHDAIVLDRGLPAVDGLDLLARIRGRGVVTPVLVLSALGLPADRVEGLDAGAEDYLAKPFDVDELLARLRALMRRHADSSASLALPGAVLLPAERLAERDDGTRVELSGREVALLALLARRPSQVFSRDQLLSAVFTDAGEPGAVDTYVHYVRRKLGRTVIRTVRGIGYQLGRT